MSKKQPTSCCCCHVKVGTFILAILFLIGGVFGIIASSLLLTNTIESEDLEPESVLNDEIYQHVHNYKRSTLWVALGNGVFIMFIALLAIYGIIKNRAGFLLPMFVVQLFNFLCVIVYIGNVMFYWPSVKINIYTCQHMPEEWKQWLLNLDDRWLAVIVFGALFALLCFKSYLISMVYRCYKHITTQAVRRRGQDLEISCVSDELNQENGPIYKPLKYEDIQKVPLVCDEEEIDVKPPPYSA